MTHEEKGDDIELQLVKDRLHPENGIFPYIHYKNTYYDIKIYYQQNYEEDIEKQKLDPKWITAVIKPVSQIFNIVDLRLWNEKCCVVIKDTVIITDSREFSDFLNNLDCAQKTATEVDRIYNLHFGQFAKN